MSWLCCCEEPDCPCGDLAVEYDEDFSSFVPGDWTIGTSNASYSTSTGQFVIGGTVNGALWSGSISRTVSLTSSVDWEFCISYDIVSWTGAVNYYEAVGPGAATAGAGGSFRAQVATSDYRASYPGGFSDFSPPSPTAGTNIGFRVVYDDTAEEATYRYYVNCTEQGGETVTVSTTYGASATYSFGFQGFSDDSTVTIDNLKVRYETF